MNPHRSAALSLDLRRRFRPRWTRRSILWAGAITLSMYLVLPYLETLSSRPELDTTVRKVDTAILAPPPPPPKILEPREPPPKTPKPKLEPPRRRLNPLAAAMNLEMAMGEIAGDFSVSFGIRDEDLADQVKEMIFDIGDLDEPPRPLARLNPMYPTRARARRIEGFVVIEFVVGPDGTVRTLEVISAQPSDIFTDSALRAIRRWRFSPGQKGGQPVFARVRQKVTFSLD